MQRGIVKEDYGYGKTIVDETRLSGTQYLSKHQCPRERRVDCPLSRCRASFNNHADFPHLDQDAGQVEKRSTQSRAGQREASLAKKTVDEALRSAGPKGDADGRVGNHGHKRSQWRQDADCPDHAVSVLW
jgi:hypothetical protein